MTGRASLHVALLALIVAAAALSVVRVQPLSALVVLIAMCVVPGAALLTRLPASEPLVTVALAIGLSLAIDTAVAAVLAWAELWHPEVAAAVVAAAAFALVLADLRRTLADGATS